MPTESIQRSVVRSGRGSRREDVTSGVFLLEQPEDVAELDLVLDELEEVVHGPGLARDIASLVSDLAIKLDLSEEEILEPRTWRRSG